MRVIDTLTNSVIASITVTGAVPTDIAVNAAVNKIYVSYAQAGMKVIDGITHAILAEPNLVGESIAVDSVTGKIYLSNGASTERGISIVDGTSYAQIARVLAPGSSKARMAVDSSAGRIYVAASSSEVRVIDAATNMLLPAIATDFEVTGVALDDATHRVFAGGAGKTALINGATSQITGMLPAGFFEAAFNPADGKIYFAHEAGVGQNAIGVIDPATGATRSMTTGYLPAAIASNPVTNRIYIADSQAADLLVLDGATRAIIARIPVGFVALSGSAPVRDVAVNPLTNRIYTNGSEYGTDGAVSLFIRVIDGNTNEVIASIPRTPAFGGARGGVAVNSQTNKIYVGSGNEVLVLDGASNVLSSIALDPDARARFIAVDPANNRVYVTHTFTALGNDFTAINGATNQIVATAAIGFDVADIAVNTTTGRIYIANDGPNYVRVLQRQVRGSSESYPILATLNLTSPNHLQDQGIFSIAVNSVLNRIYVSNTGAGFLGSLYEINGITNALTATYDLGRSSSGVEVNSGNDEVYAANTADGTISILSTTPLPPTTLSVALNTGVFTFSATQTSTAGGINVRLQNKQTDSTTWTNLPGGGQMTRSGAAWTLAVPAANLPEGAQQFRAVAAAPGFYRVDFNTIGVIQHWQRRIRELFRQAG